MTKKTLTPTSAVLLALMTMIGGGFFVNPRQLAETMGAFSPLGYIISSLLMLPIILSIAELACLQPVSGGLYVYSKQYINPFAGFLSGWTYFLGKATSAAFLTHTVNTFFYNHFAVLQNFHPLVLDATLIGLLTTLHIIGISITSKIQYLFSAMKFTPLIFGLLAGFLMFDGTNVNFISTDLSFGTLGTALPACLYALIGFEIICAIGGFIQNPARNIRRTILIAFSIVSIATILFQIALLGSLGDSLAQAKEPMLNLGFALLGNNVLVAKIINGLVFASITGGAFFILGGNCWNLYTLANNDHLPCTKLLTRTNSYGSPWVALVVQALTSITMIGISTQQLPLQNMVIFSMFSCFLMTCVAAINAGKQGLLNIPRFIPVLAIGTCSYVIGLCLSNMIKYGVSISFLSFFAIGLIATLTIRFSKTAAQP